MINVAVNLLTTGRKAIFVVERSKDSSEPFVCKYQTIRFQISQDEHLGSHRCQILKSHEPSFLECENMTSFLGFVPIVSRPNLLKISLVKKNQVYNFKGSRLYTCKVLSRKQILALYESHNLASKPWFHQEQPVKSVSVRTHLNSRYAVLKTHHA